MPGCCPAMILPASESKSPAMADSTSRKCGTSTRCCPKKLNCRETAMCVRGSSGRSGPRPSAVRGQTQGLRRFVGPGDALEREGARHDGLGSEVPLLVAHEDVLDVKDDLVGTP